MDIKFKNLDGLEIEEYAIREMTDTYPDSRTTSKYTAFQALISGKNISKNRVVHFFAKYYDRDRNFLGLDEHDILIRNKHKPVAINAKVAIPEKVEIVEIELESRIDYGMYIGWLWSIFMAGLITYGLNAIFHFGRVRLLTRLALPPTFPKNYTYKYTNPLK